MMRLDWFLATRFLTERRAQTSLIVAGVAVGVSVQVFIGALIGGLQADLIARTLGSQPHVVLRPEEERARRILRDTDEVRVFAEVERPPQRVRSIEGWQRVAAALERDRRVRVVSPRVAGPALASRGAASEGVVVQGAVADAFDRVIPVARRLAEGEYRLEPGDCLIGVELADDLGIRIGEPMRLEASSATDRCTVRGVFDLGGQEANSRWVIVPLRTGQTLFAIPGGVSHLDLTVDEIFAAEAVAQRWGRRTGLTPESWMSRNEELLTALRSQSMSSIMIQTFVMLAVAMGIASVLVVAIYQRAGQIGILRAIGTQRSTIVRAFLLQGLLMGATGAALGSLLGTAFALGFERSAPFEVRLDPALYLLTFLVALGTGVLAAALPSLRAARLDPVEAIRHE